MKKSNRLSLLFRNDRFIIVISLVISVCIWAIIGLNANDTGQTVVISDIPIVVELPENSEKTGLKVFSPEATASVTVKGNRMTIGSLTKADISVFAQQTSQITIPGIFSLPLSSKKLGVKSAYEIISISPQIIPVSVDRERSIEKNIINQYKYKSKVPNNYYSSISMSREKVTITGPENSISKIDRAEINGSHEGELTSTKTVNLKVFLYDIYGEEIFDPFLQLNYTEISVTIEVLPMKSIPVKLNFLGTPAGLGSMIGDIRVSVDPQELQVAGTPEKMNQLDNVVLDSIDFTQLSNKKNVLTLPVDEKLPGDVKNINHIETAEVYIDFSDFKTKTFRIPSSSFSISGLPDQYKAEITTKNLDVTIIGPEDQISKMTENDLTAKVDFSIIPDEATDATEVPVIIKPLSIYSSCWAYNESGSISVDVIVTNSP